MTPANKIRFITPDYTTKFEVMDLGRVKVNGKVQKVYYIDDYHFGFVGGLAYHICQYAEVCERSDIEVKPLEANGTLWMLGLRK